MMKIAKSYYIISAGSLYNRWNYIMDFKSREEAEATVASAEEVNPARNMAGTCSMDYIEHELGQITAYIKRGLIKVPNIGIFRIPKHFKSNDKDLSIFLSWILECYYECGDQSALNQSRNATECQELLRRYRVPDWRWNIDKKYLYTDKDRYYRLA